MSSTTGTMPSSRKTTIYLGRSDYTRLEGDNNQTFDHEAPQTFRHEPPPAEEGHSKLSHEGEEVCNSRSKIGAWFAERFAAFATACERLKGKLAAKFNKQHVSTISQEEPEKEAM